MEEEVKICVRCDFLGECSIASLGKLLNDGGCGSYEQAEIPVIQARLQAHDLVGTRALKEMLKKNPPKKPLKKSRR